MDSEKKNHDEEEIEETGEEEEGTQESGGSDDDKPGDGKSGTKKVGTAGGGAKSFTQEQLNKMMTREKKQGRNAAFKELGIDPKDTKMVNMFKAFIESQKTDDQKAAEQEAANNAAKAEAEQRALVAEAKAEAMMQGVKTQYVDDIVTLALAKMTDDADLKTIIGEFKTKYPVWFGQSEDEEDGNKGGKGKTGQKGTGSSVKPDGGKKGGKEGTQGVGARLAAQRKASASKSSYWGGKKN